MLRFQMGAFSKMRRVGEICVGLLMIIRGRRNDVFAGQKMWCFAVFAAFLISVDLTGARASSSLSIVDIERQLGRSGNDEYLAVLRQLDSAGYEIVEVSVTILNRLKIRARNRQHLREIVVSRASGAVLRDIVLETYKNLSETPEVFLLAPESGLLENYPGGIRVVPRP